MEKVLKKVMAILLIISLFVGVGEGIEYLVVDDTTSVTRLTMHQLYEAPQNIDILFVGSSHVYRSFVPAICDEKFSAYTFNGGTSAQMMDGSLAMIKEALAYHDVKKIYLDMYYDMAQWESTQMSETYEISDYMRMSIRKIQYLLSASPKEYYINSFIPARREWEKLLDVDYIKNVVMWKSEDCYKNYKGRRTDTKEQYYVDRGFVANCTVLPEDDYWNTKAYPSINVDELTDVWYNSLYEIIELCEKKGIELTLVTVPEPEWTIVGVGNYDEYNAVVRKIASETGVKYYDFNLCRDKYFDCNNRMYFMDEDHLNATGAEVFSKLFCAFFNGEIAEEELFYETLEQKIEAELPMVYGLAGPKTDVKNEIRYARVVSNRDEGIEYRITLTTEAGEERLIQEFSEKTDFNYPLNEHGMVKVEYRMRGEDEGYVIETEY